MQIQLDPNPCIAGWGPCIWGFAHACDRGGGHTGSHHCGQCDARTKDRPSFWESSPGKDLGDSGVREPGRVSDGRRCERKTTGAVMAEDAETQAQMDISAVRLLRTQLEVQRILGDLVMKNNPYTVLEAVRDWVAYMDRCVGIVTSKASENDGLGAGEKMEP